MSKLWTEDDLAKLVELKQNNVSYSEIAKLLNRTKKSVINKVSSLGLGKKLNYWTEDEDSILIKHLDDNLSHSEIATILGRTKSSVSGRVAYLGLAKNTNKKWSEEDINLLTKLREHNTTTKEISDILNRTIDGIYNKTFRLDLVKKVDKWSEEEDNYLFKCLNENFSYDEIAKILGRTTKSISHRVSLLGLTNKTNKWSKEDIRKLGNLHVSGMKYSDIATELDRSVYSVYHKAHKLENIKSRVKVWTNEDDELLKRYVEDSKSKEEISRLLDRTKTSIIRRITYLGIGKPTNKSQEQFLLDVKSKFPNIEVLGDYVTAKTKILVKYIDCWHTAEVEPNGLLSSGTNSHCRTCFPKGTSKGQMEVEDFLKNIGVDFISKDREILNGKELDIFIPDHLLGIEYNGEYWHSDSRKEPNNLYNKTVLCENYCIDLIHIWEHEWINKKAIVKSRIAGLLGLNKRIFARKTNIQVMNWSLAKEFLDMYHLQGAGSPTNINIGLYLGKELVALMTFGKPRFNSAYEYELVRYCSILNTNIVGGAGKLLKYFIKVYKPKNIVSYSDRRWGRGNLYRKLGFIMVNRTEPNYFYFKGTKKISRYQAQKHKLEKLIPEYYDPSKTENDMMSNAGYIKCYDCGNYVWSLIV